MSAKSLSEVVYNQIFPGGLIPLKCKDNIAAIDARIQEIRELATGKVLEGMNRRIKGREASQRLTDQIVALRESCSPPMSYREIMRRLGNVITPDAARNRYDDFVAAKKGAAMQEGHAATSGEAIQNSDATLRNVAEEQKINSCDHIVEPDEMILIELKPVEKAEPAQDDGPESARTGSGTIRESQTVEAEATTRNSRIVEISGEVSGPARNKYGRFEEPVDPATDAEIIRMSRDGLGCRQISAKLQEKGILITWQRVRGRITYHAKQEKAKQPEPDEPKAAKYPSLPGGEGAKLEARGTPEEERPAPRSISRADLNIKIWDAYQAGDTIEKISADLNSEGYYYDERQVRNRLKQQGADL